MSNPSKAKGNAYERQLVQQALASGLPAERAWGSNGQSLGHHAEVDLLVAGYKIQAKRRARLPTWLTQAGENVDAVAVREDRGKTVIILDWFNYLDLIHPGP